MKKFTIWLLLVCSVVFAAHAQDKIVKRNGVVINGKVTEVGVREIKYQSNPDANSAKFVIRHAEVERIDFANGETFIISERSKSNGKETRPLSVSNYKRNIVTISPFKAVDSGPGLGFSYERIIGANEYIGLILPVSFIFKEYYNYSSSYNNDQQYFTNVYLTPGVKIYPFGQRKVTYAVGPNVMLGFNKTLNGYYDYNMNQSYYNRVNSFRLGLLINNYLNFQITPLINFGVSAGLGMRYIDRVKPSQISYYYGNSKELIGDFSFNFGLRF